MSKKFTLIIITHGRFGAELLEIARHILREKLPHFVAIELPFMSAMGEKIHSDSQVRFADRRKWLAERIVEAQGQLSNDEGMIVLTDIIGGSSFSVAEEVLRGKKAVLVSGVNLPMLLKAASLRSETIEAAARELVERSRKAIDWLLPGKDQSVKGSFP